MESSESRSGGGVTTKINFDFLNIQFIDLFIKIRYLHPKAVVLPLYLVLPCAVPYNEKQNE